MRSASAGSEKLECDFILRNPANDSAYVQVSRTIADQATEEREYRALEAIRDSWPKYLLTMDSILQKRNGVIHANIESFMARRAAILTPMPSKLSEINAHFPYAKPKLALTANVSLENEEPQSPRTLKVQGLVREATTEEGRRRHAC